MKVFHVSRVKQFFGTAEEAFSLAQRDDDQFLVVEITMHRGIATERAYMTFYIKFEDGDEGWLQYSQDLWVNECFLEYCATRPELKILTMTSATAAMYIAEKEQQDIEMPPTAFYIDLRVLGFTWYDRLQLPDSDAKTYIVAASFHDYKRGKPTKGNGLGKLNHKRAIIYIPLFDDYLHDCSLYWFESNAYRAIPKLDDVVVDVDFLLRFPHILGENHPKVVEYRSKHAPLDAGTSAQRRGIYRVRKSSKAQAEVDP